MVWKLDDNLEADSHRLVGPVGEARELRESSLEACPGMNPLNEVISSVTC